MEIIIFFSITIIIMPVKATFLNEKLAHYIEDNFSAEDDFLANLCREAAANDIPDICIGGAQGAFLQLFLRSMNAKYVLEIGSLAGYSAITMARALPEDGKVICLELSEKFCDFIRKKADEAGLAHKIEVHQGNAVSFLQSYKPDFSFDFIFIDADKPNYIKYFELTLPLLRSGGVIAGDNALAWGYVADKDSTYEPLNVTGIQNFNKAIATHKELTTCMIPVGDGMVMGLKH
ncbi:MAG: O-methyltransferase [Ignavibacteriae bacterium]|nr:O-methyltransferase [Ignavibacteriota bacterium]